MEREQCHLLSFQSSFSHFLWYPPANWAPLVLIPRRVGLYTFQDPLGLSNKLSCEAGSFSCHCNPHRFFSVTGFEAFFPCAGILCCLVCLAPQLFLLVYLHANVGLPTPPAATLPGRPATASLPCHESSPPWPPISAPPTNLDECFFFNSLVVTLPYSLIFLQLWLFFCF